MTAYENRKQMREFLGKDEYRDKVNPPERKNTVVPEYILQGEDAIMNRV